MIIWPSREEIENADKDQIDKWWLLLPTPCTPHQRNVIGWLKVRRESDRTADGDRKV